MTRREFAQQFQAIHRRLWLVAAGCVGDRTEADDIVQEAAVIAFRKLNQFQSGTNFAAWLTQIVRHCAANYRRKVTGRRTFVADPGTLDHVQASPTQSTEYHDTTLERLDIDDEMLSALTQLTPMARCCLLLRVVDDVPYHEISQLLDVPEGTAMSHVFRSKKLIRERLRSPESSVSGDSKKVPSRRGSDER